jgi:spore maturation protein CgeB
MKIMFVDLQYDYGVKARGCNYIGEDGFRKSMVRLGHDVLPFYYDEYLDPSRYDDLQRSLMDYADAVRPDLVFFILFENQFALSTLDYLKSRYTTMNWFCDDQWRFDGFTKIYAPHFSLCVTTDKYSVAKYRKIGQNNVIISQWAAIDEHHPPEFSGYEFDVVFVGGIHPYRAWFVDTLGKRGIKIKTFGHGWKNGSVAPGEMARLFRHSKISLNLSNSLCYDVRYVLSSMKRIRNHLRSNKGFSQIKARNFEIPFFGGFQLAEYVPGLDDYFDFGSEIICYKDIDEAEMLIRYYLEEEEQREEIRLNGQRKAAGAHGYYHRLRDVFEFMKKG